MASACSVVDLACGYSLSCSGKRSGVSWALRDIPVIGRDMPVGTVKSNLQSLRKVVAATCGVAKPLVIPPEEVRNSVFDAGLYRGDCRWGLCEV